MTPPTSVQPIKITHLPPRNPESHHPLLIPAHHVGDPTTSFRNPWPSASAPEGIGAAVQALKYRFGKKPDFIPVPENREGLVGVRKPAWNSDVDPEGKGLKVTWIGHASFLVETAVDVARRRDALKHEEASSIGVKENSATKQTPMENNTPRGIRILCDPVFSERTSPVKWAGPKRYTPPPCTVAELPEIDLCCISHNHYDHLDLDTIKDVFHKQNGRIHFLCGLGNKAWFLGLGCAVTKEHVTELDWWDSVQADVEGVGSVRFTCTPAQHFSARTLLDRNKTLWCSWVIEEMHGEIDANTTSTAHSVPHKLFFAGDTGYRHVSTPHPTPQEEAAAPVCPAFREIGDTLGPFDLALLPIGLCTPRDMMSTVHCTPEDSILVHKDLRAKKSIGMHYGTVRGGISMYYEDVTDPPRRWREAAEREGLKWGEEIALMDVGETVVVD